MWLAREHIVASSFLVQLRVPAMLQHFCNRVVWSLP